MFGYIVINKPELKIKDFDIYSSFYCGLCQCLHKKYGRVGQITLNYDLTFLAILLSALYEPDNTQHKIRCFMHPLHKRVVVDDPYMEYAADMTILLTYLKCEDDWMDNHKHSSHMYQRMMLHKFQRVKATYPEKVERITRALADIHVCEQEQCDDLDKISSLFGKVMGEICCYQKDEWHDILYRMGDYLGRYIYIMDAYDDVEEDIALHTYNPFKADYQKATFNQRAKDILELMMVHSSEAFEILPIFKYRDILRNILYSGIWSKYEVTRKKRAGENDGRSI